MSWLHPAILGWCALAAAPFLLHWILRERIRRIVFGGTRFLGSSESAAASRKHWLEAVLLLLRVALLLLLVVAFARPFLARGAGVSPMSVVLVDCSRSMLAGGRFQRAQAVTEEVLRALPGADQIIVAGVGNDGPMALTPANDLADALSRLHDIHCGGGNANLLSALALAVSRCGRQPATIHLISALASAGFPTSQRATQLPGSCRLVIHDVAQTSDLPVESVRVSAEVEGGELTPGEGNLVVAARLVNRGQARTVVVRLHRAQQELDHHTVELPQDGTSTITLRGSLMEVGEAACTVSVDDVPTALPDDNRCRLVASVVRQIRIALVDGHPDGDHTQDSAFFLAAALRAGSVRRYTVDLSDQLPRLDGYQAVILACPARIGSSEADALSRFVDAGGGLLVLLGPGLDPDLINAALSKISPARVRSWREGEVTLSTDAAGAALFGGIIGEHGDNLSLARFSGCAQLKDAAGSHVLLRFSDQSPALISDQRGQGVSMLLAEAFDRRVGDFPLRPLFLPLVRQMVGALHADAHASGDLSTGSILELGPNDLLAGPHGTCPRDADGHLRAVEPGFYHLIHDGSDRLLAVNGDPAAANPVLLQPEDVQRLIANQSDGVHATSHGLERVLAPDELRQAEARLSLGRWCLLLVGVLLLVELLVAQSVSRR